VCAAFLYGEGEVCQGGTGRCFLSGGKGVFHSQSMVRYREERPFVTCLDEPKARKVEREGKEGGSLAEAELAVGGAQATLRVARRLRYLQ